MASKLNKKTVEEVKKLSENIDEVVDNIVSNLTKDLDALMNYTKTGIDNHSLTSTDLQEITMEIPVRLYSISIALEKVVLKETLAKELTKERYNFEMGKAEGTVAVKTSIAEQKSQEERMVENMYKTAKARIEAKKDNAQELLNSCKKILSFRMVEMDMERGK